MSRTNRFFTDSGWSERHFSNPSEVNRYRDDAWRPIVEYAANVNCRRLQSDPSAPTCRSPVPGEGLPRDQWCIWCEAREVF